MEPSICRRHTSIVNMVVDLVYGGAGTLFDSDLVPPCPHSVSTIESLRSASHTARR